MEYPQYNLRLGAIRQGLTIMQLGGFRYSALRSNINPFVKWRSGSFRANEPVLTWSWQSLTYVKIECAC